MELNHKKQGRLEKNVISNGRFSEQVWVVPRRKQSLQNAILKAGKFATNRVSVIDLETVYDVVAKADLHQNALRTEKTKKLTVVDTPSVNTLLDKYLQKGE